MQIFIGKVLLRLSLWLADCAIYLIKKAGGAVYLIEKAGDEPGPP
jgi:hypothetical protein